MKRSFRGVVGLILALSLFGSACAGDDSDSDTAATDDTAAPANDDQATASDINRAERDKIADGGQLVWPLSEMPPNFNPIHVDGTLGDNNDVMGFLLPSLFKYDAKAQPTIDKDYFEAIDLTSTDPEQVITYRVNPKAVWLDGTPINFKDFEAYWKATSGADERFQVASTQGEDKIKTVVQGKDDREIIVTLKEKFADWRQIFAGLLPVSTTGDPDVFNTGWTEKPLTSAGPFKFDSLDKTAQTITLVRNEKWWGNPAKLERIIYRVLDPDGHVEAMANGEVDFAEIGPDINKFQRASATPGVELRKAAGPDFRHIDMNAASEVLSDVKVRKALGKAINRDVIAKAILTPLGLKGGKLGNHIYMGTMAGYKDNAGLLSDANTGDAAKLFDEAGWKVEGAVRKKDGKELVIRFVIPSGVQTSKDESELVKGMLEAVNVKVNIETVPVGDFFEKYIRPGNYDFTVFSWLGTVFPISSAKSIYQKPTVDEKGEPVIRQNYARNGSDELDALFDKATSIFDTKEAQALGNQIDSMIWDSVHSLTLYQRPQIYAVRNPKLANFGASGFESVPGENIGYLK